jgi:glycosyltransferase involved in cell wall biosynthesis
VDAPPRVPADREALAALVGRPLDGRRLVLSLGRLVPRKGFAWFTRDVVPLLPDDALYLVAGEGPERDAIVQAAREAGAADRVLVLVAVDERAREALLATSEVFVQPNVPVPGDMEGFGIVVLEAGAAGLPVVASALEGLKDAVRDGVNGLLVASRDAEAFAAAVRGLLDDEAARGELGESAARYVREELTWDAIARRYLDAIEECAGRTGRR